MRLCIANSYSQEPSLHRHRHIVKAFSVLENEMKVKISKHVRLNSNKCTVYWMNDDEWLVIGKIATHRVTVHNHRNIKMYICDCNNQAKAKNGICSHALAVWKAM